MKTLRLAMMLATLAPISIAASTPALARPGHWGHRGHRVHKMCTVRIVHHRKVRRCVVRR